MKICFNCNHLEADKVDFPEHFKNMMVLYCKRRKCVVMGYDEREIDKHCPYFEKKKGS